MSGAWPQMSGPTRQQQYEITDCVIHLPNKATHPTPTSTHQTYPAGPGPPNRPIFGDDHILQATIMSCGYSSHRIDELWN
jgi:hypothetical protein